MEYIYLDRINSTQDYIKKCLAEGRSDTVALARVQDNGKGRHGRSWVSFDGGLWFSFDTLFESNLITLAVGIAVYEACKELYNCKLTVKWPNDLLLNGRKVAGILCEKVGDRVIVGIGINTNIESVGMENTVAFLGETGISVNNVELMSKIIENYNLIAKDTESIIKKFRARMDFIGEKKYISALKGEAEIIDITDEGHLLVRNDEGIKKIFIGEIF